MNTISVITPDNNNYVRKQQRQHQFFDTPADSQLAFLFFENLPRDMSEREFCGLFLFSKGVLQTKLFNDSIVSNESISSPFSDNYFSPEVDLEFLNTHLPPENMQNEHFPSKIIVSIASNIWVAASIIKLFGFTHIAEQMQNKEPTQRPTLTEIKKQLQLIEEELKNENSPPAKKFKSV